MSITNPDSIHITADDQELLDAVDKPITLTAAAALRELMREKSITTDEKTHDGLALLVGLDTKLTQAQVIDLVGRGKAADISILTTEVLDTIRTALTALQGKYILDQ